MSECGIRGECMFHHVGVEVAHNHCDSAWNSISKHISYMDSLANGREPDKVCCEQKQDCQKCLYDHKPLIENIRNSYGPPCNLCKNIKAWCDISYFEKRTKEFEKVEWNPYLLLAPMGNKKTREVIRKVERIILELEVKPNSSQA